MDAPETIVCVDCGQTAHRLTYPPEEGWEVGDYVAYRCSGCNDRWDLVLEEEDSSEAATDSFAAEARAILESRKEAESKRKD